MKYEHKIIDLYENGAELIRLLDSGYEIVIATQVRRGTIQYIIRREIE